MDFRRHASEHVSSVRSTLRGTITATKWVSAKSGGLGRGATALEDCARLSLRALHKYSIKKASGDCCGQDSPIVDKTTVKPYLSGVMTARYGSSEDPYREFELPQRTGGSSHPCGCSASEWWPVDSCHAWQRSIWWTSSSKCRHSVPIQ